MELAGLYVYAFIVGSMPTAYIIGRLAKGIDIRQYGSGNVGGANVFSTVGRWWVVPLGLFEGFVKGASPVWIGAYIVDLDRSSAALVGAPLLAIAGNNWSVYLKFTGGRGIGVASGALFGLGIISSSHVPLALMISFGIAVGGWALFRSSGTWVYISLLLLPLWSWLLSEPIAITGFSAGLIGLVSAKRLLANWEPLPADLPWQRVLFNRLWKDRDTDRRDEWLGRSSIRGKPDTR